MKSKPNVIMAVSLIAIAVTFSIIYLVNAKQLANSVNNSGKGNEASAVNLSSEDNKTFTRSVKLKYYDSDDSTGVVNGATIKFLNIDTNEEFIVDVLRNSMLTKELEEGRYQISELTPPRGYEPNNFVHNVEVNKNNPESSMEITFPIYTRQTNSDLISNEPIEITDDTVPLGNSLSKDTSKSKEKILSNENATKNPQTSDSTFKSIYLLFILLANTSLIFLYITLKNKT